MYNSGKKYIKAGVVLGDIVPGDALQGDLFGSSVRKEPRYLMQVIDNLNISMGEGTIKFASLGLTRDWKMRQEMRSKRATTRWDELQEVV